MQMWQARGFTIARIRGVPLQLHWTLPLGLFIFGRFRFAPVFWASLALLVLWHEIGHAIVVRACKKRVTGLLLHGGGGLCFWQGEASAVERSLIAWGGVWAQLVVLALALVAVHLWGRLLPAWSSDVRSALLDVNAFMIAYNLLPVRGFDGVEAWPLFPRLWRRRRRRRLAARGEAVRSQLAAIDRLDDAEAPPDVQKMLQATLDRARQKKRAD